MEAFVKLASCESSLLKLKSHPGDGEIYLVSIEVLVDALTRLASSESSLVEGREILGGKQCLLLEQSLRCLLAEIYREPPSTWRLLEVVPVR